MSCGEQVQNGHQQEPAYWPFKNITITSDRSEVKKILSVLVIEQLTTFEL